MSRSEQIRRSLEHPVIDTDGHVQEYMPAALPYLREALGPALFERYLKGLKPIEEIQLGGNAEDRRLTRVPQGAWWGSPGNARDLATAMFPKVLYQRMDELGIDFAVLYPSAACGAAGVNDDELRQGLCRGFNDFFADVYGPYADRFTVAGIIPMVTPDEAIAELHHCHEIGLKVVAVPEGVLRPIPAPDPEQRSPWLFPNQTHWYDRYALDSIHDYDPVWQTFVDLGYPLASHGGLGHMHPNIRTSVSSYVWNHIGSFAAIMHSLAKTLFLGGVTRRFPTLNVAFLECGVAWGCALLADLVEHWEKRGLPQLEERLNPDLVDWDVVAQYLAECGEEFAPVSTLAEHRPAVERMARGMEPADHDEFRFAGIQRKQDIYDRFVPRFFFGCEADDRTVAFAFSKANSFEARLQAMFSSDIGHWDVPDMADVVAEAHGLVRKGLLTEEDFRDFVYTNPVKLFTGANPRFFDGTVIDAD